MNRLLPLLFLLFLFQGCATGPSGRVTSVEIEVNARAVFPEGFKEEQVGFSRKIATELGKTAAACGIFRDLYGAWPVDIDELATRTEGIDYAVFEGKVRLDLSNGGCVVIYGSGEDEFRAEARPISLGLDETLLAFTREPGFKLRFR